MLAARMLSQEELALGCGVDRSYLGAIERGEQNPGTIRAYHTASPKLRTRMSHRQCGFFVV